MESFLDRPSINLVMYVVLLVLVIWATKTEHKDIHCPNFDADKAECDEEGGMSFSHTKPKDSDSCVNLVEKMGKAAGAESNAVKWRKALVISSIISLTFWVFIEGYIPDWKKMYLGVILGFVVVLGSYLYYSYHIYGVAEEWALRSLDMLKKKGCLDAERNPINE